MKKNKKYGFTLIELLGVIVILGIIALIVTPPIINNVKKSDDAVKSSNLEYVYSTGESYIKDNSNTYPMNEGAELCIKVEELMNDNRFKEGTLKDGNISPNQYLLYTVGKNGKISYELNLYDDENCEKFGKAKLISGTVTSNSIAVSMHVDTDETNLKYEFSIDGGNSWSSKSTSNQYTFTKLTNGLDYYILGRATNTENETIVASIRLKTLDIGMPEYTSEPDLSTMSSKKVITIHYPERQSNFIYEYSLDKGKTWVVVPTGTTKDVTFTSNGTITARVRDGYNVVTARTLTITNIDGDAPSVPTAKIRYNNSTGTEKENNTTWVNKTLWWGEFKSTDIGLGIDHFEYSDGCTGTKTGDLKQSYIYAKDTNKTYCIRAVDKAGNTSKWSEPYYIKIDKTKPTCGAISFSGTAGTNGWYRSNVTVNKTNGSDATSGHASTTVSHSSITSDTKGTTVTLTTKDNAGNSCTTTKTVKVDKTNPTISGLYNSSNGNWVNKNITISFNTSDATSGMSKSEYSYDKVTWYSDWDSSTTTKTSGTWSTDRNNTVYIRALDNAGNVGMTQTYVRIDKTAPSCPSVTVDIAKEKWTNKTATLTIKPTSDTSSWVWYTNTDGGAWSDWGTNTAAATKTLSGEGVRQGRMKVSDSLGNARDCYTSKYYIDKHAAKLTYTLVGFGSTTGSKTFNVPVTSSNCQNGASEKLVTEKAGPSAETYYYTFTSTSPWDNGTQVPNATKFDISKGVPYTHAGSAGNKPGYGYIGVSTGVFTIWTVDQAGNKSNVIKATTNWCVK